MIIGIDASRANAKEKTGTEWYSWHLIRALVPKLRGQTIRLYAREALEPGLAQLGKNVETRVLTWRPGVFWSHLRLSWELFWHRPDLLFVPADTVPLWHPRRTVTTIHDVAFERWPELYQGKSVQRRLGWLRPLIHLAVRLFTFGRYSASERDYHRWSVRHAVRTCPVLLTVSEFSKQEIVATVGADPKQIVVTPLGVRQPGSLAEYTPARQTEVIRSAGVSRPYVLFIGRLEEKKNIDLLLASYIAYRRIAEKPCDLVLIGNPGFGWEKAARRITADVRPFIHQLGWIDEHERWCWQLGATALVFLSAYEGFGLPPLESFSAGVPVLASRAGSLPEILGDAAMFVESRDPGEIAEAIKKITTDEDVRRRMREQGHVVAAKYTWDRTADVTIQAFLRVLPGLVNHNEKW